MLSKDCHEETIFSLSPEAPAPPDRRRELRHLTILRVGALIGPGGRELCLIRNISAGGLMAHVYSPHAEGDKVVVELRSNQHIPGTILWVEESNVGIGFDETIDVEGMLAHQSALDNGWRHRAPRVEVDRLATLRCGAHLVGVNTRDISQGGVKVEIDEPIESGEPVVLMLDKLRPIHGVVRWCHEGLAGIAFNQVIPFHELMGWLRPEPGAAGQ
jgi:hypothetical protein